MAQLIIVEGESGTGKSYSMRNLDPESTFIINVTGKPLPFKGWKRDYKPFKKPKGESGNGGNMYKSDDADKIANILKYVNQNRPEIENIVIDDFHYISSFEYFRRAKEKGWDKFNDIGQDIFNILNTARELSRWESDAPELKIFVLAHIQTVEEGFTKRQKMKTVGKMVDEKLTPEGLATVVLFTEYNEDAETREEAYGFSTQTDGTTTAKSPPGMFKEEVIDNDLALVSRQVDSYYYGEEENED